MSESVLAIADDLVHDVDLPAGPHLLSVNTQQTGSFQCLCKKIHGEGNADTNVCTEGSELEDGKSKQLGIPAFMSPLLGVKTMGRGRVRLDLLGLTSSWSSVT